MNRQKLINNIYQILGKYGSDREDIKADFRKLCSHYESKKPAESKCCGRCIDGLDDCIHSDEYKENKAEEIFYDWAATYGDDKKEADICKYGKGMMIDFAKEYAKRK